MGKDTVAMQERAGELEKPSGGHLIPPPLEEILSFYSEAPRSHPTPSLCKKDEKQNSAQVALHKDLPTPGLAQACPHTLTPTRAGGSPQKINQTTRPRASFLPNCTSPQLTHT